MKKNNIFNNNFPDNKKDLQRHIEHVFDDPATLHKVTKFGKNIYYHEESNTIVIFNPYAEGKRGAVYQPVHSIEYYKKAI